jgi:anti-anti-sigma factor
MLNGNSMATFAPDPGVSVLRLQGENDAFVAPRLRCDVTSALNASSPVIVDLTAATSIDASVFRILLEGLAECEKRERAFLLLLPDDEDSPLTRLFRITGLAGLLPIVSSWEEALVRAGAPQADAPGWTSPLS